MGDDFAKWLLRIVAVIGVIAFGTTYAIRHDWSKGWMPSGNPDYSPPPPKASEPPAPRAAPAPQAGDPASALPASTVAPADTHADVPCQPIGRTARGELVYSMDCRTLPAR